MSAPPAPTREAVLLLRCVAAEVPALAVRLRAAGGEVIELAAVDALPSLAHVAALDPALPELIVTLPLADDRVEPISVLLDAGGDAVDRARSQLLVVERHAILPGRDAVRLVFALRRLPRLDHAQFCDYWLNCHAAFGRRLIPPFTYHQLHADVAATVRLAAETGLGASDLDGIVEVDFPSVEALVAQLSRPEVAEGALADERNFIDHARSMFWFYHAAP